MKTPAALEFEQILEKLAAKAVSAPGAEAARKLYPEGKKDAAERLMKKTMEAETLLLARPGYPVCAFSAIDAEIKRLSMGASLSAGELLKVAGVFKAAKYAAPLSRDDTAEIIPALAQQLFFDEYALKRVEESILGEEELSDSASPALYKIRQSIKKENEGIREKLQGMIRGKDTSKYLQEALITQRGGRFVVPVKAEYKGNVPGIVHEKSASGATLFIEPSGVVDANNRIREWIGAEQQEIARILAELSALFAAHTDALELDVAALTELDLLFAKASLALSMKAVGVDFADGTELRIVEGRHPLIDPDVVVPVTIELSGGIRSLIITGPNTGGKTVTLKLVGLFCAMAQAGLFVPAKAPAVLPVFDGIFADIGDEQSIEQSLSTFSAHMKSIIFALKHAGKYSLVLLDELGAGTDPQEGSALARAVLTEFDKKRCILIATTHIGDLKAFADTHEHFENASMEFDATSLTPTYRLIMGVAGRSNALLVSKKLGLPKNVLDTAYGFMDKGQVEYTSLLENAEKASRRAQAMMEDAKRMKEEAKAERKKAKIQNEKAAEKRKKVLEQANNKAVEIISDAKQTAEDAIAEAKKLKNKDEATRTKVTKQVRDSLSDKRQFIEKHKKLQKQSKVEPVRPEELHAGDAVKIISMDIPATVVEPPNAKGMVKLQAGIMTIEQHVSDLALTQAEQTKEVARTYRAQLNTRRAVPMELDLHGQAVDDAIILLDKYLDDAFLSGLAKVFIVHGRGTGVLRKGVMEYMRTHPHVKSMRPGEYDEGGIGVTVVTLK
ncbi:MAG: endonuclease MutS2 [Christensenellaceae bacterium]